MKRSEELATHVEAIVYRIQASEQLQCEAVSLQELRVIVYLSKRPGARMATIARHLMFGSSHLTAIVDRLVDKKMVQRDRTEADRRVVMVTLTDQGRELAGASHIQKRKLAERMLASLNETDQEKLMVLMRKVVARLGQEDDRSI